MSARTFDLADVLTVTTGRVLCPIGDMYDVLNFLTGGNLFTHQLPRAMRESAPAIYAQHPDLADIALPESWDDEADVIAWLAEQVARFGATRDLTPMDPADHTHIDPLDELAMMRPDVPVIAIEAPTDGAR